MKYFREEAVFRTKINIKDKNAKKNNVVERNSGPVHDKKVCEVARVAMMSAYQREINGAKKEGVARNNFSKTTEVH